MRIRYQFQLISLIRDFFKQEGFLDVITPVAVENPGMEVHIHPFQLKSVQRNQDDPRYLHTSPEFCMKELLSREEEKLDNIFTITYCFRDEPNSPIHRSQFLMLEWYRKHAHYQKIMEDTENLIQFCLQEGEKLGMPLRPAMKNQVMQKMTMQEIFQKELGINILDYLDVPSIKKLLKNYPDVPVPEAELEWDDYFFLLYLNKIEPKITKYPMLMIYEFPAPLKALSTLKPSDPRVCERFEVYINGVELCNAFNELTDVDEQIRRFDEQMGLKKKIYGYQLTEPREFYQTLQRGLPPSAGIALGVERLLTSLFEVENPFYA
ncbi:MAG TPA: amino acid--tRNA ligase-related protein [Bacteriovoracaceae bacterium]|nr:amino acid--tRNA ligase-related protein [Bacteriovoracaceae bacterium]